MLLPRAVGAERVRRPAAAEVSPHEGQERGVRAADEARFVLAPLSIKSVNHWVGPVNLLSPKMSPYIITVSVHNQLFIGTVKTCRLKVVLQFGSMY